MPVDWKSKESYQRLLAAMVAASGASKDMKVFSFQSISGPSHYAQSCSFHFQDGALILMNTSILEHRLSLFLRHLSVAGSFLPQLFLVSTPRYTTNP